MRNPCFQHQEKQTRLEISNLDAWRLVRFPSESESLSFGDGKLTMNQKLGDCLYLFVCSVD